MMEFKIEKNKEILKLKDLKMGDWFIFIDFKGLEDEIIMVTSRYGEFVRVRDGYMFTIYDQKYFDKEIIKLEQIEPIKLREVR